MDNGQRTIKNLFEGNRTIFNIPKYQRAYAWEEKHLDDFVDDLENQNLDNDYFFGSILFQEQEMANNFDIINIVDGQQRITTIIIFMKLLLDRCSKQADQKTIQILKDTYIENYGEYKLRVLQDDNEFFKTYILQNNSIPDGEVRTPSQRRLRDARDHLCKRLEAYSSSTLWAFKDKIERMKVLTYSVKGNAEAAQIFETTNDRGKSLTNLEKTKSFLMYNFSLVSNLESPLETLQERFGKIYQNYEIIADRLDEGLILQYHFIAFEKWKHSKEHRQPVQMIKQQVNTLIKANHKMKTQRFIDRYSRELQESFITVKELLESQDPYILDIFALNRSAVSYSLLMKAYKLDKLKKKPKFKRVARLMEIICFRLGIGGYRVDRGRETLYQLARDFKEDFDQLINALKNFVDDYCNDTDFRRRLLSTNFYEDVNGNDQRYLFWKYENHLRTKNQPIHPAMSYQEFANKDSRTKFSIEHIHSQTPSENEVDVDESQSIQLEEDYLHGIGNLMLDPISANSSKSNHDFEYKYENYYSGSLLKQQNELKTFLKDQTGKLTWDKTAIDNRKNRILEFALDYWNHKEA